MYFDRIGAKRSAKERIRSSRPSPLMVTLIFLLLTSGISALVQFFLDDPIALALRYIMDGYDPVEVYAYLFGGSVTAVAVLFLNVLLYLYKTVMNFGYYSYSLRVTREGSGEVVDLFDGFSLVVKVVVLDVLTTVFTFLWSLLFFFPGIMALYAYSQAVFCLLDDPDISPMEAIRRSKRMMQGQKMNLFVVQVSFLGWILLSGIVAGGVGYLLGGALTGAASVVESVVVMAFDLWLMPYRCLVYTRFYHELNVSRGRPEDRGPEIEF